MEPEYVYYNQQDYIETVSGNKVCKKSVLLGSQNIMLHGKVSLLNNRISSNLIKSILNYLNLIFFFHRLSYNPIV